MKNSELFETRQRPNGKDYVVCMAEGGSPLRELIRDIHDDFGCWPNDWIYKIISEAFDDLERDAPEDCNVEADIYTHDLITWLEEPYAMGLCDEYRDEMGDTPADLCQQIASGQWLAKRRIYSRVAEYIEEQGKEART